MKLISSLLIALLFSPFASAGSAYKKHIEEARKTIEEMKKENASANSASKNTNLTGARPHDSSPTAVARKKARAVKAKNTAKNGRVGSSRLPASQPKLADAPQVGAGESAGGTR